MLVGNLMALRQTQVKRLLAYSSLSHDGLHAASVWASRCTPGRSAGAQGGFFHLLQPRPDERAGLPGRRRAAVCHRAPAAQTRRTAATRPLTIARPERRGPALPAGWRWPSAWRCWAGWAAAAGRFYVEVADLCGRVSAAKTWLIGAAGGLRRAEQRALAGLLRPAGQRHVPRQGLSAAVEHGGRMPRADDAAADAAGSLGVVAARLLAQPDELADRSGRAGAAGSFGWTKLD